MLIQLRKSGKEFTDEEMHFFDRVGQVNFYAHLDWINLLHKNCFEGQNLFYLFFYKDHKVKAVLPFTEEKRVFYKFFHLKTLKGLSNFYSCDFPVIIEKDVNFAEIFNALKDYFLKSDYEALYLDSLQHKPEMKNNGVLTDAFKHFSQRYCHIADQTFEDYFQHLPTQLKNTLRRKGKKIQKDFDCKFQIFDHENYEKGLKHYEIVYPKSWQKSEPHQNFVHDFVEAAARQKKIWIAICFVNDKPIAAQIWLEWQKGHLCIYKLAYDQDYHQYSPGSLLLQHMMQYVFDQKLANEIDFGRGDDRYKREWLSDLRDYWGLVLLKKSFSLVLLASLKKVILSVKSYAKR